ncbi:hypothetical protein NDU88_000634 [Pleurodeles waltl]|uniref:Uncharacterized protein n=1 Tax=Pleurodeles waltl TaxID=8319 RepID=A0AAV7N8N8_PLEWA|nr:hypothetical protein NDU88_000634 [Pleurodeles waltl]
MAAAGGGKHDIRHKGDKLPNRKVSRRERSVPKSYGSTTTAGGIRRSQDWAEHGLRGAKQFKLPRGDTPSGTQKTSTSEVTHRSGTKRAPQRWDTGKEPDRMGRNRGPQATQTNNLDKYTVQLKAARSERDAPDSMGGDPSLREIMDAIKPLWNNIESKINAVTSDVNLLRIDLRKVTHTVTTAEGQINRLQAVNKHLEKQVQHLTKKHAEVEAKLEDQDGRALSQQHQDSLEFRKGTVQNYS